MNIRKTLAAITLGVMLMAAAPIHAQSVSSTDISGYNVEQLEQLIAKLQRQLEEMKKGSQCFVSERELSIGDGEGDDMTEDVRRLQNFLAEKGYFNYKATGYFGKMTRASLMAFQKAQGLAQSGEMNGETRAKMHTMYCKKVVASTKKIEEKKYEEKVKQSGVVNAIKLKTSGGNAVYWAVDGYSKSGFKVVWSKSPSPTYPNRMNDRYQYFDNPMQSETKLEAFEGSGTYYVRVCEYLGGSCGVFSNEVQVQL